MTANPALSLLVTGRTNRGVEIYRVLGGEWEWLGTCERFKDPNWKPAEYYSTIQTAVVDNALYLLGRSSHGVEVYRWAGDRWSDNLGTCERFKDPNWKPAEYYSTIQTAVVDNALYLLGRGSHGVELYRWEGNGWSDNLGTCERFKDPNWKPAEYYGTIQTAVVDNALYLLGRSSHGVEVYRWAGDRWSGNLGTCARFKDPNWKPAEYYSTIQTAVVDNALYLLGRSSHGVELYRWEGDRWSGNLGTCARFKDPNWKPAEYYSTIQTAVVDNALYLLGRSSHGVELYRWEGDRWSDNLGTCERFKGPLAADPRCYRSITSLGMLGSLVIAGLVPLNLNAGS